MKQRRFIQKNQATFTHFVSVPLILQPTQGKLQKLMDEIHKKYNYDQSMNPNNPFLFHITISMLGLQNQEKINKAKQIFSDNEQNIKNYVKNVSIRLKGLGCFQNRLNQQNKYQKRGPYEDLNIIYLNVDETPLLPVSDFIIRQFLQAQIFDSDDLKSMNLMIDQQSKMFRAEKFHITLFRMKDCKINFQQLFDEQKNYEFGETSIKYFDISTRWKYDKDKFYQPLARIIVN
ncbi:unnamed protein product [Paramecium sonneborni]|uniref:A-kinase anchor protein 7-like phosphoesterase domain-containing protein n=1 Tax=Paramecium sonneborni TaxID=65129 RepID=A0A8S1QUR0_9CILI|nr:unnamed protein product [Paramecium sonneborni]